MDCLDKQKVINMLTDLINAHKGEEVKRAESAEYPDAQKFSDYAAEAGVIKARLLTGDFDAELPENSDNAVMVGDVRKGYIANDCTGLKYLYCITREANGCFFEVAEDGSVGRFGSDTFENMELVYHNDDWHESIKWMGEHCWTV